MARRSASRFVSMMHIAWPGNTARRMYVGLDAEAIQIAPLVRSVLMVPWAVHVSARKVATSTMTALLSRSAEEEAVQTPVRASLSVEPTLSVILSIIFPLVDVQRATRS